MCFCVNVCDPCGKTLGFHSLVLIFMCEIIILNHNNEEKCKLTSHIKISDLTFHWHCIDLTHIAWWIIIKSIINKFFYKSHFQASTPPRSDSCTFLMCNVQILCSLWVNDMRLLRVTTWCCIVRIDLSSLRIQPTYSIAR